MKSKIISLVLGMVQTNCYLLINEDTRETLIIDPGAQAAKVIDKIKAKNLKPSAILLTHGHFDHIMAVPELVREYQIPIYAHEDEEEVLLDPELNACAMVGENISLRPTNLLRDKQKLNLAGFEITVLHTPGHTKGGACFYVPEIKKVFSGDTLFEESIGRTDLPTGSYGTLISSVQKQLFGLDDLIEVLPGHGPGTTIIHEKRYNPYINH